MQILIRLFFLVVIFSFCSCAINRTIPMRKLDASIVPSDFNPKKHVLLVVEMESLRGSAKKNAKVNRMMDEKLKEYYPYKYEIVSLKDIRPDNPKYADTSIYKYAVLNSLNSVEHTTYTTVNFPNGGQHTMSPSANTTYITYRFLDRVSKKEYGESSKSAWIKTSIQAFANAIIKAKNL